MTDAEWAAMRVNNLEAKVLTLCQESRAATSKVRQVEMQRDVLLMALNAGWDAKQVLEFYKASGVAPEADKQP